MSAYELLWLTAFIKTQVIEVSLGLSTLYMLQVRSSSTSRFPTRYLFITLFMASALTHPPLWFVLPSLRKAWGLSYQDYVLYGEIAVCLIEGLWYMLMLPDTRLGTPLMAPNDASKAAWEFNEKEYERRRAEGTRWRAAREDEVFFDDERARTHPFQFTQQGRRSDITVSVRPPPGAHQPDSRLLTLAVPSPLPSRLPRCQFRQRRVHHTCASA